MVLKAKATYVERFLLVIILITITFIWVNSMLPGETSSSESGFVMNLITPILELFVGKGNVTMHMVRKLAHFTEYFMLGAELSIFTALSSRMKPVRGWIKIALPLLFGLLIAAVDETIQIFSVSRGPSIKDVVLDFTGVCAAVLIVNIVILIINGVKRRQTDN